MSDSTSWNDIRVAVTSLVDMCDGLAGDSWQTFYNLMLRFVDWDEEVFGWSEGPGEPSFSASLNLEFAPAVSNFSTVLRRQTVPMRGSVRVGGERSELAFRLAVCTNSWLATADHSEVQRQVPHTFGVPPVVFPRGLLVLNEGGTWADVVKAMTEVIDECELRSRADPNYFRVLLGRFVIWEDDEFDALAVM